MSWSAGNPVGSPTVTYYWVIGTSPSVTYGNGVAQSTTTGTSANTTSLSPGTTYYLRVYAYTSCNSTSSSYATSSSFTTSNPVTYWIGFYNIIDGNSAFNWEKELVTATSNTSNPTPVKICADGSNATKIRFNSSDLSLNVHNLIFRIQNSTDPNLYGTFSGNIYIYSGTNPETVSQRFTHPTYMDWNSISRPEILEVFNTVTNQVIFTYPLDIYRAPVLFVHGFGGDLGTFASMKQYLTASNCYPSSLNTIANYSSSSLENFVTNAQVVPQWINVAFNNARNSNFSAGKVDIVGHSMGGILTRLYLQNNYVNPNSYRNDINKLITINTPHSGSYLADAGVITIATIGSFYCGASNLIGANSVLCNGALIDMQTYSYATDNVLNSPNSLSLNHVPSHTITTTFPSIPNSYYEDPPFFIYGIANTAVISLYNSLSQGLPSDGVVSLNSQTGGLVGSYTSHPAYHVHIGSAADPNVKSDVKQLLFVNPTGGQFSLNGFSPTNLKKSLSIPKNINSNHFNQKLTSSFIKIISPSNGNSYIPNQLITLVVNSDTSVKRLIILSGNSSIGVTYIDTLISSDTTYINYRIPSNVIGKLEIDVIGFDPLNIIASDSVTFNVNSNATLDSIEIDPNVIIVPTKHKSNYSVIGYYSNGASIDVTSNAGIQYNLADSLTAKLVSPGVIEGISIDSTLLTITLQGKSKTIPIYAYDGIFFSHALFSSNTNTLCDSGQVAFINLSSGHPQNVQWSFPGGSPSISIDSIPIVTYNSIGKYNVSLIATYFTKVDTLLLPGFITIENKPFSKLSLSNDTIYCSKANGYSYQWYHNNKIIENQFQYFIFPDSSGYYYVDVMNNAGCIVSSDTIFYTKKSINSALDNSISIYPNPSNGKFTIIFDKKLLNNSFKIFNAMKGIIYQSVITDTKIEVDLKNVPSGIYFIQVFSDKQNIAKKILLIK